LPVLGADTVVVREGEVLEKPKDAEDARRMLYALSGRSHEVITGFAVITPNEKRVDVVKTRVVFRTLSAEEIEAYVRGGEPMDKAGGYGIQAGAAHFVTRIEGSYTNVVGLPMAEVVETFRTSNVQR
jgi:septum formation protein